MQDLLMFKSVDISVEEKIKGLFVHKNLKQNKERNKHHRIKNVIRSEGAIIGFLAIIFSNSFTCCQAEQIKRNLPFQGNIISLTRLSWSQ